jgi:hypothetical protein
MLYPLSYQRGVKETLFMYYLMMICACGKQAIGMLTDEIMRSSRRRDIGDRQIIGHSSNAPWPNLKKLTMPASTTAMTTALLP